MEPLDPFDPEALQEEETAAASLRLPRHRPGEWFLRGPVPWTWLQVAAQLPGQALALSLCLWREGGRSDRRTVKLCLSRVGLGISEGAARRALRAMEKAGLVTVKRLPGKGLEVTLLDVPPPARGEP